MNSQQGKRYIKHRIGDELKHKILELSGIKIAQQPQAVSRTCGRCGYVNKLENKFCERVGCNYPLTQLALDEIKATEQAKLQLLVNESNIERDNTIRVLQQELKSYEDITKELVSHVETYRNEIKLFREQYGGRRFTMEEGKRLEEFQEQLRNAPDSNDYD
jgi:hypothetical protein